MKKTLFLSAILGAALCSSAFGAATILTINDGQAHTLGNTTGGEQNIDGGSSITVIDGTLEVKNRLNFSGTSTLASTGEQMTFSGTNGYNIVVNGNANLTLTTSEGATSATYDVSGRSTGLAIGSGATLTLDENVTLKSKRAFFTGAISGNGTLVMKNNSSAQFTQDVKLTGLVVSSGAEASFSAGTGASMATLTLNEGSKLNLGDNTTLTLDSLSGTGTLSGTIKFSSTVTNTGNIKIGAGSTVVLDGLKSTQVCTQTVTESGIYDSAANYSLVDGGSVTGLDGADVTFKLGSEQKTATVSGNEILVEGSRSYVVAQTETKDLATVQAASGFSSTVGVIVSGTLTLGTTTIQKDIFGTGTVQISNNRETPNHLNNFEGTVEIMQGGTLNFKNQNNIASAASCIKINSGAMLHAWQKTITNNIELAGGTLYADDSSIWSGKITLTADSTLEIDHWDNRTSNLTGLIEGNDHNLKITQIGNVRFMNNVNLGTGKMSVVANSNGKAAKSISIGLMDNTSGDDYSTVTMGGLTLASGTALNMRYVKASFGETVLNGNAISVYDIPNAASITMSSLEITGENTLAVQWKGTFNLGAVTGSGSLAATHDSAASGDPMKLNLSVKDFSGTLSATNNANTFVNVASANQADELNGTLSGNVTLNDGFTKIGDGALTLTGSLKAAGSVSISAGTLEYNVVNSAMNVAENTVVSISQTGKFAHDGFEYMANGVGATATLTATTGVTSINVNSSALVVADAKMVKTSTGAKYVGVALDNVDFTAAGGIDSNFGLTVLFKDDKTQSLSNLTIEEANKVKVQNSNFSATTVANDGQLEIASGTSISIGSTSGAGSIAINGGLSLQSASEIGSISGTGSLNLSNSLTVTGGTTTIGALTLGEGSTITLGSADENGHNFDLTTTTLTVNGDATMNANLVVESGTLNFEAGAVLTMGCEVTISGSTVYVTIEGTFDEFMADLRAGNALVVIDGLDSEEEVKALTLDGLFVTDSSGNTFTNNELSLRVMESSGFGAHGNYCIVVAPEPATATLSLLALAALASRRRRH